MTAISTTLKTLAAPLLSPAQFDFWAHQFGSTTRWERCLARVESIQPVGRDTVMVVFRPNGHWEGFAPGQHCNVSADIGGRRITRSYSLAAVPGRPDRVCIMVRREPEGAMSNWLHDECVPGTLLELGEPFGDMVLPASFPGHLLLMAAGSGVTPMISLLRALAAQGMPYRVTLLLWERSEADAICREELLRVAATYPAFTVELISTRLGSDQPTGGRINPAQLEQLLGSASPDRAYACGPRGFVRVAQELMDLRKVDCQTESFEPPVAVEAGGDSEHAVHLLRSGRTLSVTAGKPLLDQLEAAGVAVSAGCRQGLCNSCTCFRVAGATADLVSGRVDKEPGQPVRLCISRANTALELDL